MNYLSIATNVCLTLGTFFCLVSALGILRFSDVFLRIHAATKASTLGVMFICLATALRFANHDMTTSVISKCLLVVIFLFMTAPISAHLIGRAAKMRSNPMTEKTVLDEYET